MVELSLTKMQKGLNKMDFNDFIYWAFLSVISGAAVYGVGVLTRLNDSIKNLNVTVAKMIVKHEYHDKEIEELKDGLKELTRLCSIN